MGHRPRPDRRVLLRRGGPARRAYGVRRRRREAVDLLLPGGRSEALRRGAARQRRAGPGRRRPFRAAGADQELPFHARGAGLRGRGVPPARSAASVAPRPLRRSDPPRGGAAARPRRGRHLAPGGRRRGARVRSLGAGRPGPAGKRAQEAGPPHRAAGQGHGRPGRGGVRQTTERRRRGGPADGLWRRADPGAAPERPVPRDHPRPEARGRPGRRR